MSYGGMVEYAVAPDIRAITEDKAASPFGRGPISMDPQDFFVRFFPNENILRGRGDDADVQGRLQRA
jgi:hypothetical protein